MLSLEQRFLSFIQKNDTGCWLWTGYKNKGYGYIGINHKPRPAYRIAWELYKGTIPSGLVVRHRCPEKSCCNPEHLMLGTQKDNMRDAVEDGTIARGEASGTSKLTEAQVLEIRKNTPEKGFVWEYAQIVAEGLNMKPNSIYEIIKRRTWSHL